MNVRNHKYIANEIVEILANDRPEDESTRKNQPAARNNQDKLDAPLTEPTNKDYISRTIFIQRSKRMESQIMTLTLQLEKANENYNLWKKKAKKYKRKFSDARKTQCASNTKLKSMFSKQQRIKLSGRKPTWTSEDIVKALTVRSISLKAYETVRLAWKVPLPAVSTLRSWVKNFTCAPGILCDVLEILKQRIVGRDNFYKLCVLKFDEMSVDSRFGKDPTLDCIDSHSKVQVAMLRGLCSAWKQPIYFDFDTRMSKELLFRIIRSVTDAGFILTAIVSDLGGENQGLWNELNISQSNVSFQNPYSQEDTIFVYVDIPHQLKNIRNHILDDGFFLRRGTFFQKADLEEMIANGGTELRLCPNLTQKLIEVKGSERMRVLPAVQLLSHRVAMFAKKCYPQNPEVSDFFEIINNGFDVFNSRGRENETNPFLKPFGLNLVKQKQTLQDLASLISEIRFATKKKKKQKKALLPCQVGFLVSIKSLLAMHNYLKTKFGVSYILTSRLNTDALESFFSVIRSFNCLYANPTPSEFRYRLRLVLLGCRIKTPRKTNAKFYQEDVEYLSARLMDKNAFRIRIPITQIPNNSNSPICTTSPLPPAEEASLRYLAGYIAWQLKRKGKTVYGIPTGQAQVVEFSGASFDWIRILSRGGLLVPNATIVEWVTNCEMEFRQFAPYFQKCFGVTKILIDRIVRKHSTIDLDVVKEFIQTRIRIKIKMLNEERSNIMLRKRKARQFANSKK